MKTFLLICTPPGPNPWQSLLQHQAILAATRAVLSDPSSEDPAWSGHRLLAPCNLDILPLLATVARDFASFVEPEGTERATAPVIVYEDGSWGETEGMEDLQRLLHPAWFQRLDSNLAHAVEEYRPETCIVAGDLRQAGEQLARLDAPIERCVYFESLGERYHREPPPGEWIAADQLLLQAMERAREELHAPLPVWLNALRPPSEIAEEWDLEPFTAFGPALELALWGDGRDGG